MPVNEKGLEAAMDEAKHWDEGFTSSPREYQVLRLDGDDVQTVSRHPDRAEMEAALSEARMSACIEAYLRASSKDAEPVALSYDEQRLVKLMEGSATAWEAATGPLVLDKPSSSARTLRKALALIARLSTHPSTGGEGGTHKLLNDIFDFLGGVDGAAELRARILTAIEPVAASPGVPDGWKAVPVEPTRDMLTAFVDDGVDLFIAGVRYKAMLKAAPAAPASPEPSPASEDVLREALQYAAMGLGRIHDAMLDTSPKQAVGEMVAHFRDEALRALSSKQRSEKE